MSVTGLSRTKFNGSRHRKVSGITAFGILLTKLRTGLSTSILRTLFNVKCERYLSRIVKRAREALLIDFVPKYVLRIFQEKILLKTIQQFLQESF